MMTARKYTATSRGQRAEVEMTPEGQVRLDGVLVDVLLGPTSGSSTLRLGGKTLHAYIQKIDELHYDIWIKHYVIPVTLETPLSRTLNEVIRSHAKKVSEFDIKAPMPGLIREVLVATGDLVVPGTPLLVLEAMKMENEIRSAVQGTVKAIVVKKQDAVEKNQMLIEIEAKTDE